MPHDWIPTGRSEVTSRNGKPMTDWDCQSCGGNCAEEDGVTPDPNMVFWKGIRSEVETCEETIVDEVHDR